MKKSLKIISIVLLLVVTAVSAVFLPACKPEDASQNVSFALALARATETENKSINSVISFSLIIYDAAGKPMKVTQTISLDRVKKDDAIYIKGSMGTSDFILSAALNALLDSFVLPRMPEDVGKYIKGDAKVLFEIGYSNGNVNARGDVCAGGVIPDYKYTLKGEKGEEDKEYSLFVGAGFADILAQQGAMGYDYINGIDIMEMVMKPVVPPVDFSTMANVLGDNVNPGTGDFNYQYVIPGGSLVDLIIAELNKVYGEYILKIEDEEDLEWVQNVYNSYYEMVKGWVIIGDTVYTGSANAEGYLLSSGYETKVTIRVPDTDIIKIATELELTTESEINTALNLLHTFISSENGVKNVFEISFVLNIQETFGYNPEIDLTSMIFTPASEDIEGRTVLRRERETEDDEYRWNPYGGDFSW